MSEHGIDFILNRQSCRNFKNDPLAEGDLQKLKDALRWAPSAGNSQPWFFYMVTNQAKKEELGQAAYGQSFIADAPVIFIICSNADESAVHYGERGRELYCLQDTAAATQNILLAATVLGYGCCWIGAFQEEEVRNVMAIPKTLRPVAMVPVGHIREMGPRTDRKSEDEIFQAVE